MHLVPVDLEARPVEGRLRVELVVHEPETSCMCAWAWMKPHVAERPEQLLTLEQQPRNDRVVGALAGVDPSLHGEAGAAVLEDDAVPGATTPEPKLK